MTANASAVSRALVAAGFTKSVSTKSGMIRGWSEWNEGFRCSQSYDRTSVLVEWKASSFSRGDNNTATRDRRFTEMTAALTAKGYTVTFEPDRYWPRLVVTK